MSKAKPERKILDDFNAELLQGREDGAFWESSEDPGLSGADDAKKERLLKERLHKLEDESTEKNRLINSQRKQLDDTLSALEEKERKGHELEILTKTMEANLHQLEGERRQYLVKIEDYGKELNLLNDRLAQNEEDLRNLTGQLKSRTQENILLNKENKDVLRGNNQLRESLSLVEGKVKEQERELAQSLPERAELEKKYSRSLESLRNEVKAKHQEILRLGKETADLRKANHDLQRVNENLELELDMLNTTNVSLQKKIEKLTLQNSVLEKKLSNKLVRFVLALCSFFGWNPERRMRNFNF